ncbi:MAG: ATP-binding cassette domain-containing protein [Zoogloeaceae bacterium]|nr:ATP-binding cassette domain-containing protein [Zoogloeaceae bacterium]
MPPQPNASPSLALAMQDLVFSWPGAARPVLEIPHFTIRPGERVFLSGPSGSGKSTLLALIAGILRPVRGSLVVQGVPCGKRPPCGKPPCACSNAWALPPGWRVRSRGFRWGSNSALRRRDRDNADKLNRYIAEEGLNKPLFRKTNLIKSMI